MEYPYRQTSANRTKYCLGGKLQDAEKERRTAIGLQDEANQYREKTLRSINSMQAELDGIRRKVFDEAFSLLDDAYKSINRRISGQSEEISAAENATLVLEKQSGN